MRVKPLEIELASDEEYHRAHGVDAGVSSGLLKQLWWTHPSRQNSV